VSVLDQGDATPKDETKNLPASKLTSPEFWGELIIKQGVSAMIAVWLVYSLTTNQQQTLQRLESTLNKLSLQVEKLSDRIPNVRN
jgi:hypothetical protein